jgi:hypothetical protein
VVGKQSRLTASRRRVDVGWLLYPGRFGIVVVAPESAHVNLAEVAHVWFRLDGPSCPDFSHGLGTI